MRQALLDAGVLLGFAAFLVAGVLLGAVASAMLVEAAAVCWPEAEDGVVAPGRFGVWLAALAAIVGISAVLCRGLGMKRLPVKLYGIAAAIAFCQGAFADADALAAALRVGATAAHAVAIALAAVLYVGVTALLLRSRAWGHGRKRKQALRRFAELRATLRDGELGSARFERVFDQFDEPWQWEVEAMRDASLHSDHGLELTHGGFGSERWRKARESGEQPTKVVRGVVTRLYMAGREDTATFDLASETGEQSYLRRGDEERYAVGKCAIITSVRQRWKGKALGEGEADVVLTIDVEA